MQSEAFGACTRSAESGKKTDVSESYGLLETGHSHESFLNVLGLANGDIVNNNFFV